MDVYDAMRTTFAAREFTDDPVDDATLYRILDNARFGPSGGNRQGWRVIVVRDPAKRTALIDLIRPTMQRYVAQVMAGENPWNTIVPTKVDAAAIAAASASRRHDRAHRSRPSAAARRRRSPGRRRRSIPRCRGLG